MAAVNLVRGIEPHQRANFADPELANVDTGHGIARDGQTDEIRHRSSADQRAAGRVRKTDHLFEPGHHLPIDQGGRMVSTAQIRPEDRGKEITHRAGEIA